MKKHPPDGDTLPNDPPEKRIRARILAILEHYFDPGTYDFDIMQREMSNPTGLLFDAV